MRKKLVNSVITPEDLLNCDYIEVHSIKYDKTGRPSKITIRHYKYFNDENKKGLFGKTSKGKWDRYFTKSIENAVEIINDEIKFFAIEKLCMPIYRNEYYLVYSDGGLKSHSYRAPHKSYNKFVCPEKMF